MGSKQSTSTNRLRTSVVVAAQLPKGQPKTNSKHFDETTLSATVAIILFILKPHPITSYYSALKNINYPFNKGKRAGVLIVLQVDQQALETALN